MELWKEQTVKEERTASLGEEKSKRRGKVQRERTYVVIFVIL